MKYRNRIHFRKDTPVEPGVRFKVGAVTNDEPFVMPGSVVEVIAYPGQRVEVNGREYKIPINALGLRVVRGELGPRLKGFPIAGFMFHQVITRDSLHPLCLAAAELKRRVLRSVGVKNA
jgi:hypothetical protein